MLSNELRLARSSAVTLVEVLVSLSIVCFLLAVTLPAIQQSRASASRLSCLNNLRQIGVALQNFESAHGILPPLAQGPTTWRGSSDSIQKVSFHVYILPYIERSDVWAMVEHAYSANPDPQSAPHREPMAQVIRPYGCPSDSRVHSPFADRSGLAVSLTSYVAVTGSLTGKRDGCFPGRPGIRLASITDGMSQTIMVAERPPNYSMDVGSWYATRSVQYGYLEYELAAETGGDYSGGKCGGYAIQSAGTVSIKYMFAPCDRSDDCCRYHYWSLHSGGGNFLFADGSARLLPYAAAPIVHDLASRNGGEPVEIP